MEAGKAESCAEEKAGGMLVGAARPAPTAPDC